MELFDRVHYVATVHFFSRPMSRVISPILGYIPILGYQLPRAEISLGD